ncbi:MAG TPA: ImmA/IrrE family metallo-endopeptidase [Oscillospiraceae bacterium]|nr:ImmA/IrrE family metallo-endopeptidase [Oscillospiraceae bacterium]HPF54750.1 ImmA/IrrE family metallo-endopeptidase [Clostridia bacterium]HPK35860.1 ImmA/IrrE family metallo-endopeptidase [Oscillospiraceae bacterium]HPR76025.1 ImmA/IrrE family metallo-endopeptidase [Oscillospiraceae bacterium]
MQNAIIQEIERLKKRYGTSNPYELIDALNIHLIWKNNLGKLKGFYYVVLRERYIVINDRLHERDKLLVAGHELGHDRLHQSLAKVAPLKDFMLYDMTSHAEYEANVFCSELLIEDELIAECIADEMDYFQMCSTVGFKPQLVTFKLYGMMQRGYPINLPESPNSNFLRK